MAPAELGWGLQGRQHGPTSIAPGPASLRAHLERWLHSLVAGVEPVCGQGCRGPLRRALHSVPGLRDIGK